MAVAFLAAVMAVLRFWQLPVGGALEENVGTWISSGDFRVDAALRVDPLASIMLLVVTGIGFLIHVYATGYMSHEKGYTSFFTYLNLFMFMMLLLVLGANYIVMFVGWEGVGLCSYLLIGFYYDKNFAADAGKKAFITNRIGDFGFILGIFLIFNTFGSADYGKVFALAAQGGHAYAGVATAICLLLFVGAAGKSAQIPLYVWLPDAMAGPTPVSALIHAATMVAAGVFLVARMFPVFEASSTALNEIAIIGGIILLILIFAVSLHWLPSFGRGQTVQIGWWTTNFLTVSGLKALILPAITLGLFQLTLIMRLVRAEMLEALRTDYVKFARARGIPERSISFRHALRNTMIPVVTIAGLQFGAVIAFAIVTIPAVISRNCRPLPTLPPRCRSGMRSAIAT